MKKWAVSLLVLSLVAVYILSIFFRIPPSADRSLATIDVKKGEGVSTVARKLAEQQVVESRLKFIALMKLRGLTQKIQWGEYEFSRNLHPEEVARMLISGRVKTYKFTLPEGVNVQQIAAILAAQGLTEIEPFLRYALSPAAAIELEVPGPTLEGYLFPTTYSLRKGLSPKQICFEMVSQYRAVFTPQMRQRARELGLNERQVVTLASIVEKETGAAHERTLVASVYHNRLRKKMRLQADPTVIYGVPNFDGNLTKKHLQTPSPYNTYTQAGLPFGPIASPGADALGAALYPATTEFLYFVATGDGQHQFSVRYEEHAKWVQRYQPKR